MEGARNQRAYVAQAVNRYAIEFVGHEGNANIVAFIKLSQDFKQRGAKCGMGRGIGRKGGVKFVPLLLSAGAPSGVKLGSPCPTRRGFPEPRPVGPVPGSFSRMPVIGRQNA